MVFKLPISNLYRVTYVQQVTYIKLGRLDMEQLNSIFKESAELFRQIKVIRYNSDIIQLFFYMVICEKTVFLSDKKVLTFFQNSLLSKTFFYI